MIEQFVKANSLSCLFNEDRTVELIPEPFRMQGIVSFRVTYQEYVRYVLSLTESAGIILSANLEYLRELASCKNPKLYSYFLKDMSFAIAKEIWFSELYNRDASVILPAMIESKPSKVSELLDIYSSGGNAEYEVLTKLQQSGFNMDYPKRLHNQNLFRLSGWLNSVSNYSVNLSEVNLVYDLFDE